MDYETLSNEELYRLAYIQEDPKAQAEYMKRKRLHEWQQAQEGARLRKEHEERQ